MRFSHSDLSPVREWALESLHLFTPNGVGRAFGILQRKDLAPPAEVWAIKEAVVQSFDLQGCEQEPMFRDFCGVITEGGSIHPHMDANRLPLIHTRFNVMVSKPEAGGVPVQNGVEVQVDEGCVWTCRAGVVRHWCSPVAGPKPRIVLSFGFLL